MLRRPRAGEGGDSKSHANEKSSVDISLGGEGACGRPEGKFGVSATAEQQLHSQN
jgi:hypothetical protein